MATIRLELRSDKVDTKGKSPIRVVYQIQGQRKFYPTSYKCFSANWDLKNQKAIYIDRKTAKKNAPDLIAGNIPKPDLKQRKMRRADTRYFPAERQSWRCYQRYGQSWRWRNAQTHREFPSKRLWQTRPKACGQRGDKNNERDKVHWNCMINAKYTGI